MEVHDGIASAVQHLLQVRGVGGGNSLTLTRSLGYYGIQAGERLAGREAGETKWAKREKNNIKPPQKNKRKTTEP